MSIFLYRCDVGHTLPKVLEWIRSGPKLNLFCFLPVKKIVDLPGGEIIDPQLGRYFSLPFLLATPSFPSQTLEGLFELTQCPSRALNSPHSLLPELQRYKNVVRCGALGAVVPGHRQQHLTQTLIVRLLKPHFLTPILDFEKSTG